MILFLRGRCDIYRVDLSSMASAHVSTVNKLEVSSSMGYLRALSEIINNQRS